MTFLLSILLLNYLIRSAMVYYSYITTNPARTVLYIGVTGNLAFRLAQHYENRGKPDFFAGRYFCYHLIYFEEYLNSKAAIAREKELKGWTRVKKEKLIATRNPNWEFLVVG